MNLSHAFSDENSFSLAETEPHPRSMQALVAAVMKILSAARRRCAHPRQRLPERNDLRRDLGLRERPKPRRHWSDYL
jgi:hypothetical protein